MKIYVKSVLACFLLALFFTHNSGIAAGVKQEKEEKLFVPKKLPQKSPAHFSVRTGVYSGYDSNVELSNTRKGDIFQEFLFSADYRKFISPKTKIEVDYDLNATNYNEITDAARLLNHFRMGVYRKLGSYTLGTGYDLGISYFPENEEGDFFFHKGFVSIKKDISRLTSHQVQFIYGYKDYPHNRALSDYISTFQDKDRRDRRLTAEYSLDSILTPRLLAGFSASFSTNNSNGRYEDFYDYKAYQLQTSFAYKLIDNLYLRSGIFYMRKNYATRTVTSGNYEQKDNLYAANLGLIWRLAANDSISLEYIYRENSSNDSLAEYSGNVITCGWQHNF